MKVLIVDVEPCTPIPGGWCATCAEPGGVRFGLIEANPLCGA